MTGGRGLIGIQSSSDKEAVECVPNLTHFSRPKSVMNSYNSGFGGIQYTSVCNPV
jgi:hypothetical protein